MTEWGTALPSGARLLRLHAKILESGPDGVLFLRSLGTDVADPFHILRLEGVGKDQELTEFVGDQIVRRLVGAAAAEIQ